MQCVHRDNTENSIFKVYKRNFINISSSYNLHDVIYTGISSTIKNQFTVWIGKVSCQCDMPPFSKVGNCARKLRESHSGIVVNVFACKGCRFESPPMPSFSSISFL